MCTVVTWFPCILTIKSKIETIVPQSNGIFSSWNLQTVKASQCLLSDESYPLVHSVCRGYQVSRPEAANNPDCCVRRDAWGLIPTTSAWQLVATRYLLQCFVIFVIMYTAVLGFGPLTKTVSPSPIDKKLLMYELNIASNTYLLALVVSRVSRYWAWLWLASYLPGCPRPFQSR